MSFDTTSSNTRMKSGACTLIKKGLSKDLLYFPCRHHIFKLKLHNAFRHALDHCLNQTSSYFNVFKGNETLKRKGNVILNTDEFDSLLKIVLFCQEQLKTTHQMITRSLLSYPESFLMEFHHLPSISFSWCSPSSKVDGYCYLCNEDMDVKVTVTLVHSRKKKDLKRFIMLVLKVCLKLWFTVSLAISAPWNDFEILKSGRKHKTA